MLFSNCSPFLGDKTDLKSPPILLKHMCWGPWEFINLWQTHTLSWGEFPLWFLRLFPWLENTGHWHQRIHICSPDWVWGRVKL